MEGLVRAKRRRKLPVVLTPEEVKRILSHLESTDRLFLSLLYGTGLRIAELLRLRVKDVDFAYGQIIVRDGKGAKDRMTMLPSSLKPELQEHLKAVKRLPPWPGNIRAPRPSGAGSTSSRRRPSRKIPDRESGGGTTSTSGACRGPFTTPSGKPGSSSGDLLPHPTALLCDPHIAERV